MLMKSIEILMKSIEIYWNLLKWASNGDFIPNWNRNFNNWNGAFPGGPEQFFFHRYKYKISYYIE